MSNYHIIDTKLWKRAIHCEIFKNYIEPSYCITFELDITDFLAKIKQFRYSFTFALIHSVTKCANKIEEFRYRFDDDKVILYDKINTAFTYLEPDTELFKVVNVEMKDDLYEYVVLAKKTADAQKEYFTGTLHNDVFLFSPLPWISYTHISHTISGNKNNATPIFDWGKYFERNGRIILPFSVQAHHSFVDGIHIGKLADELQNYIDNLDINETLDIKYIDFLHDESRATGHASSISFPETEEEITEILKKSTCKNEPITIQGARTGITAGAVPFGGRILNLCRMKSINTIEYDQKSDVYYINVQPGALLDDIRKKIANTDFFFPPDPTETTASIGGMVSCNASGALTYKYGSTRDWIKSIKVILANGSILHINRGQYLAKSFNFDLIDTTGRHISGKLPDYKMPKVKSAAGYFVKENMDLIDLFIGMEGTLGIITDIELKLAKRPVYINGLMIFLPSEQSVIDFVKKIRNDVSTYNLSIKPAAIEYFNSDALNLLKNSKAGNESFSYIPVMQDHYKCAIYIELHSNDESMLDESILSITEMINDSGGSDEDTWFATNEIELETHKKFRHAVPEIVNMIIGERKKYDPDITKLGTDMSVPDDKLSDVLDMYNRGLAENRLESVIFGHIGNNHLHVNILPRNQAEYIMGKQLYENWAEEIVKFGGSVSAEHGIGKLKTHFLGLMYGNDVIEEMKKLKSIFDPDHILNPGNLFEI